MRYILSPRRAWLFIFTLLIAPQAYAERPESPSNGQIHHTASTIEVWEENDNAWLTPEQFWLAYANQSDGKFWGRGRDYPPYRQVEEHDTFLVEVDQGACLMYFFHSRWRRAQDVRRWDPQFNEILGCPFVFD